MNARARLIVGLLIVIVASASWSNTAAAQPPPELKIVTPGAAPAQESSKPKRVVPVPPSDSETVPVGKKEHGTLYDPLEMQGFSVALLLGEIQGASSSMENLHAGAKKALADLREFLPYKSYRLLDTQWIRCCAGSNVAGMLRGTDEQQYTFHIGIHSVSGTRMTANFVLSDAAPHFKTGIVTHDALGQPAPPKRVISSNFSMETGETVVIGTSSLKGDKALVVLLTAVPRSRTAVTTKKGSGQ